MSCTSTCADPVGEVPPVRDAMIASECSLPCMCVRVCVCEHMRCYGCSDDGGRTFPACARDLLLCVLVPDCVGLLLGRGRRATCFRRLGTCFGRLGTCLGRLGMSVMCTCPEAAKVHPQHF